MYLAYKQWLESGKSYITPNAKYLPTRSRRVKNKIKRARRNR